MANHDDNERPYNSSAHSGNNWRRNSKIKNNADGQENYNYNVKPRGFQRNTTNEYPSRQHRHFPPADRYSCRQMDRESVDEPTLTFPEPKIMTNASRLIDDTDTMDFMDFCKEYLMDSNRGFSVIGAVGAQSTGKSTVLSMLAENEPGDMYRHYIFRPFFREGVSELRHQTTKIYVYINKWRTIFLDCQPIGSASLMNDYMSSHRRTPKDQAKDQFELISLQLLTLMARVCDTLLLCIDRFIDMNIVGDLLRTELFKEKVPDIPDRKVNLVVLHQRADASGYDPLHILERMRTLKGIFDNSSFDVCGGVNLASMDFPRYRFMKCNVNYVSLGEIPPLRFSRASSNADNENLTEVTYRNVIHALRLKLLTLPRRNGDITEVEWFNLASKMWDRILKELKVGFNDSPRRFYNNNKLKIRKERNDADVTDTELKELSDVEKLSGESHEMRHFRSPHYNRHFTGRNRSVRQFFMDERDSQPSSANQTPVVVKIIKKRQTNDSDPQSDDDETDASRSGEQDNGGGTESDKHHSDQPEASNTDSQDEAEIRKVNHESRRKLFGTKIKYGKSARQRDLSFRHSNDSDRNIDTREYEAIKRKIFSTVEHSETSTKPQERNSERSSDEFQPRVLLRRSTSSEAEESEDMTSLHDAFCSQELSDI